MQPQAHGRPFARRQEQAAVFLRALSSPHQPADGERLRQHRQEQVFLFRVRSPVPSPCSLPSFRHCAVSEACKKRTFAAADAVQKVGGPGGRSGTPSSSARARSACPARRSCAEMARDHAQGITVRAQGRQRGRRCRLRRPEGSARTGGCSAGLPPAVARAAQRPKGTISNACTSGDRLRQGVLCRGGQTGRGATRAATLTAIAASDTRDDAPMADPPGP